MGERAIDRKLEGRLFDLLERRARIRLGQLVQLRRISRRDGVTLLDAASTAGLVDEDLAEEIAGAALLDEQPSPAPAPAPAMPAVVGAPSRVTPPIVNIGGDRVTAKKKPPPQVFMADDPALAEPDPEPARKTAPEPALKPARVNAPAPALKPARKPAPQPAPKPLPELVPTPVPRARPVSRPLPPPLPDAVQPPVPEAVLTPPPPPLDPADDVTGERDMPPEIANFVGPGGFDDLDRELAALAEIDDLEELEGDGLESVEETSTSFPELAALATGSTMMGDAPSTIDPGDTSLVEVMPDSGRRAGPKFGVESPETQVVELSADTEFGGVGRDTPFDTDSQQSGEAPQSLEEAADEAMPVLPDVGSRYVLGAELGRGGMGQVLEARETTLQRSVAIKLLIEQDDPSLCLRFIDEARVTGQLQHPNVPPVYEMGRLADGRLFFAMRRLEGRTLRDLIEDLRDEDPETEKTFGPVRLLTVFSQVCRAIAYAHSRSVIHRDLKPDNIMLGEFGEVTVMDWGLAKPIGSADVDGFPATRCVGDGRFSTQAGDITGTPQYMPPEQAAGRVDEVAPHSDIYSLGAVLYELLTLEPPFDGPTPEAIRDAVVNAQLTPPTERAPDRSIPGAIEQLCLSCLRADPAERPTDAAWIADQIEKFLEGEQDRARKAAERNRLYRAGQKSAAGYYAGHKQLRQLQNKSALMRVRIDPWAPVQERSKLWRQEDAEGKARVETARHLSEALAAFHAAVGIDGGHTATRQALRDLYYSAFEAAEVDRDQVLMAHYESLVRVFDDDGTFSARLKGDGSLEIETSPRGVKATLLRYVNKGRVLTGTAGQPLGQTPVRVDPLPMGSYLIMLEAPGMSKTPVPLYVSRQESLRLRVRLFPDAMVGEGFVHVAGGPGRLGGDPMAQLASPAQIIEFDDFFITRTPVTAGEYHAFLRALASNGSLEEARERAPRSAPGGPPLWPDGPDGVPTVPDRDAQGAPWHPQWPVVNVSCEDAEAYCAWRTDVVGQPHRLATEAEWERAARGADGRLFPWGDAWEPTFCHMGVSRPGAPSRGPAGAFPADTSPHGVLDLAGGVSDWTATWLDEESGQRIVKGGHWASGPTECRAASRFTQRVHQVMPTLGFRVVRDAPR